MALLPVKRRSPSPFRDWLNPFQIFALLYTGLFAAHFPLLRLPYFWDEAGYYVPAARDLMLTGDPIPFSTLSNAHPPLPMAYLALWWKIGGFHPSITRIAMLMVAAFALLEVFKLARRAANADVAVAAVICTAIHPVFFAQSTLAHADLPATALTLLGLRMYIEGRRWPSALAFAFASMAKETAIVAPLALAAWEALWLIIGPRLSPMKRAVFLQTLKPNFVTATLNPWIGVLALVLAIVPLLVWFPYHFWRTGYMMGNPEFFRYNVTSTMNPVRMLLAVGVRLWQNFGYMNMFVLTIAAAASMMLPPQLQGESSSALAGHTKIPRVTPADVPRNRIDISIQGAFFIVMFAYIVMLSVIGGAVLARYLLPIFPLTIIIAVSTLWRRTPVWPLPGGPGPVWRVQGWMVVIAFAVAAFLAGLAINPPYHFAPEDNLAYRDFVVLHQHATAMVQQRYPHARVLTAWPATDELNKPYLGYVASPIVVSPMENFSAEEIQNAAARRSAGVDSYNLALLFSTKYEPARVVFPMSLWLGAGTRYFNYHHDVSPVQAAAVLGGRIVMLEQRNGEWVALIEFPDDAEYRDARNAPSLPR